MKVLLHVCCGPCASACVPALRDLGHEVALYYSNSNIGSEAEWTKRLESVKILAAADDVPLFVDAYDHAAWMADAAAGFEDAPEKGARCSRCFGFNLTRAAEFAAAHGFDAFTTSLTVSPHKVSSVVFAAGRDAATKAACGSRLAACDEFDATDRAQRPVPQFLEVDFKKRDGFLRSLRRSAELGLYRQSYCGCEYGRAAAGRTVTIGA